MNETLTRSGISIAYINAQWIVRVGSYSHVLLKDEDFIRAIAVLELDEKQFNDFSEELSQIPADTAFPLEKIFEAAFITKSQNWISLAIERINALPGSKRASLKPRLSDVINDRHFPQSLRHSARRALLSIPEVQ